MSNTPRVVVIGLGYVGLPLAVVMADKFDTTGFDIDLERVAELKRGYDRTREISETRLNASPLKFTTNVEQCPPADFYILTVPTPIAPSNQPDLSLLEAASRTVGGLLPAAVGDGRVPVVIYESTVYPGVTEDICAPILEAHSGLSCGEDFFLGFSPERINPGDRDHTVDKVTKVISGQTPEILERIACLYDSITTGGVFRATSIKVAEAAKVIENAQRDINIAFMNEITRIFSALDISVWDVLDAARTKWNFLPFSPGLVGGHCISVDPYYLSHRAEESDIVPRVILAGRSVNDQMAGWVARQLHQARGKKAGSVLVLGVTFKENVTDLRNSKVFDLVRVLQRHGHSVTLHDPGADPAETKQEYGLELSNGAPEGTYDLVLLAVPHRQYLDMGIEHLRELVTKNGTLADLKGVLREGADWTL